MRRIHLKRSVKTRHSLCGIVPDEAYFTTADRMANRTREDMCKVCLRVLVLDCDDPEARHAPKQDRL
jgi:hypothetical protein